MVQVNLVTKRGSNEFRGSGRFYRTAADGYFGGALQQSQPNISSEIDRAGGQTELAGTQIRDILDFGFEAGGALITNRAWLWGSWGQNDIDQTAASGDADDTRLENTALKANFQINQSNSGIASWNNGDKIKNGRGAGPTRAPETLWDQRGPTAVYRFEDTHVFSSKLFVTGTYSIVDGGFQLLARGPQDVANGLDPAAPNPKNICPCSGWPPALPSASRNLTRPDGKQATTHCANRAWPCFVSVPLFTRTQAASTWPFSRCQQSFSTNCPTSG